mmetsp:Transcript_25433/g.59335  ORF Transcript_25433/g.59335 Transcript_25433/m.59335 type:complete len:316 (-) Transcript_25433:4-951(-)
MYIQHPPQQPIKTSGKALSTRRSTMLSKVLPLPPQHGRFTKHSVIERAPRRAPPRSWARGCVDSTDKTLCPSIEVLATFSIESRRMVRASPNLSSKVRVASATEGPAQSLGRLGTAAGLASLELLLVEQFEYVLLDGRRRGGGQVAAHHLAVRANKELREVPLDVRRQSHQLRLLRLQDAIHRVRVVSVDVDFCEHRKGDAVPVGGRPDFGGPPRLLPAELVARKSQHLEPPRRKTLVERLQLTVVRVCQPSCRRNVHDQAHLAFEAIERDQLAVEGRGRGVVHRGIGCCSVGTRREQRGEHSDGSSHASFGATH